MAETEATAAVSVRRATAEDVQTLVEMRRRMQEELRGGGEGLPAAVSEAIQRYFQRALPEGRFVAFSGRGGLPARDTAVSPPRRLTMG